MRAAPGRRHRLPHPFLFVVSDLLYSIVWVLCPATLANAHSPELGLPP